MKSLLSEKVYLQLIQRHFSREDLDGTDYEQVFDIFVLAEKYSLYLNAQKNINSPNKINVYFSIRDPGTP